MGFNPSQCLHAAAKGLATLRHDLGRQCGRPRRTALLLRPASWCTDRKNRAISLNSWKNARGSETYAPVFSSVIVFETARGQARKNTRPTVEAVTEAEKAELVQPQSPDRFRASAERRKHEEFEMCKVHCYLSSDNSVNYSYIHYVRKQQQRNMRIML